MRYIYIYKKNERERQVDNSPGTQKFSIGIRCQLTIFSRYVHDWIILAQINQLFFYEGH